MVYTSVSHESSYKVINYLLTYYVQLFMVIVSCCCVEQRLRFQCNWKFVNFGAAIHQLLAFCNHIFMLMVGIKFMADSLHISTFYDYRRC